MSHLCKIGTIVAAACLFLALNASRTEAADSVDFFRSFQSALRVPGFTAYSEPEPEAMEFSERDGVIGWTDDTNRIVWYGMLKVTGRLDVALSMRLPATEHVKLRLTVAGKALMAEVQGADGREPIEVSFGTVTVSSPGYYRFVLEGLEKQGKTYGNPDALLLNGPASVDAQFNLLERRNAASVHLGYPIPTNGNAEAKVVWFYNEVTVRTEPIWSYYMTCGFRRGYFGIQVNSPTERRIIFSVWDSGNEAVDRSKVGAADRVQLVAKGANVIADSFGNEGTGGHSHLVYSWKKSTAYRFLVSAKPEGTHTIYSGYFYFPEKKSWGLIASFRAPKDGDTLRGLYSFNENFGGANGQLRRMAEFGNQWIKTDDGQWLELSTARFTHDPTGKVSRKDFGAGVTHGRFYLSNGGFVAEPIRYGDQIHRPATGKPPTDIALPAS